MLMMIGGDQGPRITKKKKKKHNPRPTAKYPNLISSMKDTNMYQKNIHVFFVPSHITVAILSCRPPLCHVLLLK